MNNSLFDYVNRLHELQNMFDDLVSYLFLGQASGSTLLGRELFALVGFMTTFLSVSIPQWFWDFFFNVFFLKGDHLM